MKEKKENILKSKKFLKLFLFPFFAWFILTFLLLIQDGEDSFTIFEIISSNMIFLSVWFIISLFLTLINKKNRKKEIKENSLFKSSLFIILFSVPTGLWLFLSMVATILDESETDPITWKELILADYVLILIFFIISFLITFAVKKIKLKNESKIKKNINSNFVEIGMLVLFAITILSIFGALCSVEFVNTIIPHYGSSVIKNMWIFWCWLPIPLFSIILGFIFQCKGFKCIKNIVSGFIVGGYLFIFGLFCISPTLEEDYNKIDTYRNIIDAKLPDNGYLEIMPFDNGVYPDKINYKEIHVYYDEENMKNFTNDIDNSKKWINSTELKSELLALLTDTFSINKNSYHLIYNKTTNQYNTLPETSGQYEMIVVNYFKEHKYLVIEEFTYLYK